MSQVYPLILLCLLYSAKPVCLCLHNYTTQPPADLVCNPYTNRRLQLECGVTGNNLHQIQWYFSPYTMEDLDGEDAVAITNNSKYFLSSHSSKGQLVVSLTINDLNENTDTGTYWCQAILLDGTMLVESNPLQLEDSESYRPDFECSNNNTLKSSNSICAPPIATGISVVSPPLFVYTSEPFGTTSYYPATTPPPSFNQLFILYIGIGCVGICILMCFVLSFTICILRKKPGNKGMEQNMELGKMSNQTDIFKRPDLPQFPLDTFDKSIEGDYAEIGPELMNSMHLHSVLNSHYSEIRDVVVQPPHTLVDRSEEKENPYDELDRIEPILEPCSNGDNGDSLNSYSKLERVPQAHITPYLDTGFTFSSAATMKTVNSDTGASAATMETWYSDSGSNSANTDTTKEQDSVTNHYFNSLENLQINAPWLRESLPLSGGNSDYTDFFIFPKRPHPSVILEHPYHILEQSGSLLGPDKYSSNSCDYIMEQSVAGEYDRLVDPVFYKSLDQSASKIYDVKTGPYSRLEASQSYYTCPLKLDLSLELFDDIQYVASPVPTPNAAKKCEEMSQSHSRENKYFGDYERDPMYMENMKVAHSSKLYQPLEITAMDPISAYEHYSKTK